MRIALPNPTGTCEETVRWLCACQKKAFREAHDTFISAELRNWSPGIKKTQFFEQLHKLVQKISGYIKLSHSESAWPERNAYPGSPCWASSAVGKPEAPPVSRELGPLGPSH